MNRRASDSFLRAYFIPFLDSPAAALNQGNPCNPIGENTSIKSKKQSNESADFLTQEK